jgi:ferredoxin
MIASRKFAVLNPVHTTNYLPVINRFECIHCRKCVDICPVEAMEYVPDKDDGLTTDPREKIRLDTDRCLGCGLCVRNCPAGALTLQQRQTRVLTPVNGTHRVVVMALERGRLHDLIFDNRVLFSHRALAAVLGVILKLPPLKQLLAAQQVKSRYLAHLLDRLKV